MKTIENYMLKYIGASNGLVTLFRGWNSRVLLKRLTQEMFSEKFMILMYNVISRLEDFLIGSFSKSL